MNGHVVKRSKNHYSVVLEMGVLDGKRIQKWIPGYRTLTEARDDLVRLLRQAQTGEFIEPSSLTVGQWFDRWDKEYSADLSAGTKRVYMVAVDAAREHVAQVRLQTLKAATLQPMFSAWHDEGLEPRTLQTRRAQLSSVFSRAQALGLIGRNPTTGLVLPKVERSSPKVLTEAQLYHLLDALYDTDLYVPTLIAATTGMRRGEVLALTWDRVLFDECCIQVSASLEEGTKRIKETKTGKARMVPVPEDFIEELRRRKVLQREQQLLMGNRWAGLGLINTQADGSALSPGAVSQRFTAHAKKAGLDITFHGLRHTHATLLMLKETHAKVVQERLGHANVGITLDLYSHVAPSMQREAAERMSGMVGEPKRKVVGLGR